MSSGYISEILEVHGKAIADGESAAREAFRGALQPVARTWSSHARTLVADVERARQRFDRAAASKPRAEALRLRSALITTLDGLLTVVDRLAAPGA